jgi:hypothetical protein
VRSSSGPLNSDWVVMAWGVRMVKTRTLYGILVQSRKRVKSFSIDKTIYIN